MNRVIHHLLLWLAALLCGGCRGNDFQSALHPAGDAAHEIAWLWWVMVVVYGAVFFITMGLLAMALRAGRNADPDQAGDGDADGKPRHQPPGGPERFVVVAGIIIPSVILLAMLVVALRTSLAIRAPETAFTIEVTGHQWWWDVRYPDEGIVTANELRIPRGVAVRLDLGSADVVHSFWVPNLHGKMDMFPDHVNRFWLKADRAGTYRGVCAEFCGDQHALMGLDVVVMEPDEFDQWLASRRETPPSPTEARALRGRELFFSAGCAACHAIGGTDAVATLGPDLTHLAVRRTLGAATIPNTPEFLERWIAEPQVLKPGNLMPATHLDPDDRSALVEYLQTLH